MGEDIRSHLKPISMQLLQLAIKPMMIEKKKKRKNNVLLVCTTEHNRAERGRDKGMLIVGARVLLCTVKLLFAYPTRIENEQRFSLNFMWIKERFSSFGGAGVVVALQFERILGVNTNTQTYTNYHSSFSNIHSKQ